MAFTKVTAAGISTGNSLTIQELNTVGVITAATVQVGSATTIHTTGIDLGSGNITSHNINSTGIITSTSFVGPVTGNVTGNLTGNVSSSGANTLGSLSVTNDATVGGALTVTGDLTVNGTTTTIDTAVTAVDSLAIDGNASVGGIITAQSGLRVLSGGANIAGIVSANNGLMIGSGPSYLYESGTDAVALRVGSNGPYAEFVDAGSNVLELGNAGGALALTSGGTEKVRINSSGNIGIGQTSPNALLHIQKNSSDTDFTNETTPSAVSGVTIGNLETGAGTFTALTLSVSSGTATQNGSIIAKATNSGTAPELHFTQRSNSNTLSRLVISSNGNIGIGTDNPTRKLDVEIQTASFSNGSVLNSHPIAEFINISASAPRGLEIGAPADSVTGPVYLKVSGTGNRFAILDQSNHENFTILDSGNIGIGTETPGAKLDVRGSAFLSPLSLTSGGDGSWIKSAYGAISNSVVLSLNNLLIGQNMRGYLNSDGGSTNNNYYHTVTYSSGTMGYAGLEFGFGGIAKFFTGDPATTADATFTPTERLRINAAGNISMGKAEDATGWGAGVPTFEITGNSGSYPTRGGFIGLESQSKVNGYGGMWLDNDTLSFYLGQARNSLQTPVERLRITYNSSPSVGIATNGVFHVTQNLPLTIQGQGFGHGWTQGGTQQDAIYLTAGASGTFTALTLSVDKGSWGSLCYEIHAHAYSQRYVHRLGGWYQNGSSFTQYGTTTFGDSNASFAYNAPGSQQFTITLSGGNWTHPIAWLRLAHSGAGSLNYNNISFRWS